MKKAVVVVVCFYLNVVFGQDFKINLQEIQTEDKTFSGIIDDKYQITAYLKYNQLSTDNLGVYSVQGWYYYDNVKKKIPLVGVYDGNNGGNLILYSFKSKELIEKKLTFDYSGNTWEILDSIKAITDFDERFDTYDGQWTDGKKKLKFELYDKDYDVLKNYQLLNITDKTDSRIQELSNQTKNINLNAVIRYHYAFELIGYLKKQSETRILLKYEHLSRANIQGMCGAGYEIGYIILVYDEAYNLLQSQETQIESCLDNISNEEIKSTVKKIKKFKITDNDNKSKIITIDEKSIEIKTE